MLFVMCVLVLQVNKVFMAKKEGKSFQDCSCVLISDMVSAVVNVEEGPAAHTGVFNYRLKLSGAVLGDVMNSLDQWE